MMPEKEIWNESFFELSNKNRFSIVHDINVDGNTNSIWDALDGWLARTNVYTDKSFIKYINSKGANKAMTKEDYLKIKK